MVCDVFVSDVGAARDHVLGIEPPLLSAAAKKRVAQVQMRHWQEDAPSLVPEQNEEVRQQAAAWQPPESMTRWRIRLDAATDGARVRIHREAHPRLGASVTRWSTRAQPQLSAA